LINTELVLTQLITGEFWTKKGLSTETIKNNALKDTVFLTWPSIFFGSYNPELFYLKSQSGLSVNLDFDNHHKTTFSAYISDVKCDELKKTLIILENLLGW
jgi:hypothetical protein